ncbi:FRG domain-containing protein [Pseudoalteromonas haloplanktis]|uniref:FRG domain-containing protein n=1 Tax=Pseudoalteromonas haloplanktis TaxID=228 RepID=A0ABU1B9S1_PSEHA|nr:FRG domain-containing protein [Pseudoalteromonas haloplanktis]MDQ9091260.1 FRG domain-containing protein [Pseudoalteromonas haloplanktis]
MLKIESIEDLLKHLSDNNKDGRQIWFRGQAQSDWKLLPFYMRKDNMPSESTLLKKFKQSAAMLINTNAIPNSDFDWLFLMQHYGVPTRLLDWSESPLVALYFAVENFKHHEDQDAALWFLFPTDLNRNAGIKHRKEEDYIPAFEDIELETYSIASLKNNPNTELLPVATIATRNNARIQAQHGVFTIHHLEDIPIEDIGNHEHAIKIIIPSDSKENIKKQLELLGYTKFQLFPELASIGDIIKESLL